MIGSITYTLVFVLAHILHVYLLTVSKRPRLRAESLRSESIASVGVDVLQKHLVVRTAKIFEVRDPFSTSWTLKVVLHLDLNLVVALSPVDARPFTSSSVVARVERVLLDKSVNVFSLRVTATTHIAYVTVCTATSSLYILEIGQTLGKTRQS